LLVPLLIKFRVSAHNLEIKKGRYRGVKTEDRGTLHPQKFGCTLKNEGKRVHVPLDEKPVGMMYL
jgi:hypothetical protein